MDRAIRQSSFEQGGAYWSNRAYLVCVLFGWLFLLFWLYVEIVSKNMFDAIRSFRKRRGMGPMTMRQTKLKRGITLSTDTFNSYVL
jgi:hypothetical protein